MVSKGYHPVMAMTLRLSEEENAALEFLADQQGVSKREATVRAIRESAQRLAHETRVVEATDRGLDRWADVLDRLGK